MKKKEKNNTTNQGVISRIKGEFKRHTTVLMEHMTKEVKTVAEGHSAIIRKLDERDKRFGKVESELQSVKMAVMDTNQTVKSIEKKINNHETRIQKLESVSH